MKYKIRKTGEEVDIISYSCSTTRNSTFDYVSYIDSKGEEHPNVRGLNLYWDFQSYTEKSDPEILLETSLWEKRRYEIAKDLLCAILNNPNSKVYENTIERHTEGVIDFADILIQKLKNIK